MMKKYLLLGMLVGSLALHAQDRLFTYTYQSNVLNKGQKEIEIWTTIRNERENYFRAFDHSLEFEVGLGSKLQTAFYLNYGYSKGVKSLNNIESLSTEVTYGFANEWKLKLTDPVASIIGSALYFEYKFGTDFIELESKLIFDKQIGKSINSLNIVGETEFANEFTSNGSQIDVEMGKEYKLKLNYGFAYQAHKNLALGFEVLSKNKYQDKEWKYMVVSAGPCLSYNQEGFWVNLTVLPQITNIKTGNLELAKNEKVQTRLLFSYVF